MSDFYIRAGISRSQIIEAMSDAPENVAHVLAGLADSEFAVGTWMFDDLVDSMSGLDEDKKRDLHVFCLRIAENLAPPTDEVPSQPSR